MVENSQEVRGPMVLIVEDEIEIRELLSLILLRQGYRVRQVATAEEAVEITKKENFDLVVLDWMLPGRSGLEALRLMGGLKNRPPVLMVTAKSEPEDIVAGLESGADDYLTKPFEPVVLVARAKALMRRHQGLQSGVTSDELRVGSLSVNLASYEVKCSGELIHMTPSEYKIVASLIQNQGRVLTRDQLIEIVQGEGISVTGRTIDTHVFGIRKKLGSCADFIETIRGIGYRIKL